MLTLSFFPFAISPRGSRASNSSWGSGEGLEETHQSVRGHSGSMFLGPLAELAMWRGAPNPKRT